MTGESIQRSIGKIEGTLKSFIETHASDMQRIHDELKDNRKYLEGEVQKALNSHGQIKKDIEELKKIELTCPIKQVAQDVSQLKTETKDTTYLQSHPEVDKANTLLKVLKTLGWIAAGIILVGDLILNIKDIIK